MRFTCSLVLPTDVSFVPVARHFAQNSMQEFGVDAACSAAVSLAITEACANVVEHSQEADGEFEVHLELDEERCVIRVVDNGVGLPDDFGDEQSSLQPPGAAERGRGVFLMQTMVDRVHFESRAEEGTVVHLEKRLTFDDHSKVKLVSSSRS